MAEYIEREAATHRLQRWSTTADRPRTWINAFDKATEIIESIPAADVRPVVRGKWEHFGSDVFRCSECGYGIQPWNIGVNFCPNCGADMSRGKADV